MKALVCREFGSIDKLRVEEIPDPEPRKGQVVIKTEAAGINFPDVLLIQGKYQMKPRLPFVPGTESAGIVESVGPGVQGLSPGDRVIAYAPTGAFAGKMAAAGLLCTTFPKEMDFQTAAAFTTVYGTAYHALKQRAKLQKGETLLVLGAAGGVGLAAVELGKAMGAHVIAAASNDDKVGFARQYGADEGLNYTTQDLKESVKKLTDGHGADVVFDPVGGDLSEAALRATAWEGRFLVIGFASGSIPRIPLNLPLLKGNQIVGVFWGSFAQHDPAAQQQNMGEMFDMYKRGRLKPVVSKAYSLTEFKDAFAAITERKVKGKIVFKFDD